jgi:flagellar biogenesis protein FliO
MQATPLPPAGQLKMPIQTDRDVAAQWTRKNQVGQSTFMDKLRTVTWVLAFICFLIWLIGKFASKATLEKLGLPIDPDSLLEVLEKKRISPGRSIMLLRVGPKVLAVAVTETGFRTLTEIDGEALKQHQDEHAERSRQAAEIAPPGNGPADIAKHYLSIIPGLGAKK